MFWNNKKEIKKFTFSDLVRGIQHSVNAAQEILELHHIHILEKYFNEDGTPKTISLKVDEDKEINTPIISLINQSSLAVDEMEIAFKVAIDSHMIKEYTKEEEQSLERLSFDVSFVPDSVDTSKVDVKIKFKAATQPEGVSRIVDEFDKLVVPTQRIDKKDG